jgi:phosphoenolpyruvate---glycerone phosphotransferase subunit DhaL
MTITVGELRTVLGEALTALGAHEATLRDLDAALGDGDLGITVRSGAHAVITAVSELPHDSGFDEVIRVSGTEFASANPSTFAALVGGGLLAAARVVSSTDSVDRVTVSRIAHAVADRISERGKAKVGDKTILDALVPTLSVLDNDDSRSAAEIAAAMRDLALARVDETARMQSARGRAAWVGERSIGHPDPGATAYALFLTELTTVLEAHA